VNAETAWCLPIRTGL